jgi:hypothetical protein
VKKKSRVSAKPAKRAKPAKPARVVSAKTRAADDVLRESLRNADMRVFDKALAKAIRQPGS